jgi:hypothetical protein
MKKLAESHKYTGRRGNKGGELKFWRRGEIKGRTTKNIKKIQK